jgi:N-acetylglucosamine-6-phosphate deacetylase
MAELFAISAARIFDSEQWHEESALLIEDGRVQAVVASEKIPAAASRLDLDTGCLVPGFVDLQVNGGRGVLFNNQTDLQAIRTICAAHAQFGTTALLPTLITDTPTATEAAISAGAEAARAGVLGFLGLHLEGPHLAVARKGTHDGSLIRLMTSADEAVLIAARQKVPNLLVTVAPETVPPDQIGRLVAAGIIISIGHSDADFATANAAFSSGASHATHLFNAMSQLTNREPGVVGAVLDSPQVHAGLIADGVHVHAASIRTALATKKASGKIFLVTDAMSQTGSDLTSFDLNGRTVHRANGALRLADGTLAGADLDMIDAVRFMQDHVGLSFDEALRMASLYPSQAVGDAARGHLKPDARADFILLDAAQLVQGTWIGGVNVFDPGRNKGSLTFSGAATG